MLNILVIGIPFFDLKCPGIQVHYDDLSKTPSVFYITGTNFIKVNAKDHYFNISDCMDYIKLTQSLQEFKDNYFPEDEITLGLFSYKTKDYY